MIRVGMLSKWHVHAVDYAREATQHPDLSIRLVWDENPERGRFWAEELGVPFFERLEDALASDIDAVIVDTPTNMHREVITLAAQHGKHIFSEKVLAIGLEDTQAILAAVREHNVKLMLSLPRLSAPYTRFMEEALESGLIGEPITFRCRVTHDGALPTEGKPSGWLPEHFFDLETCGGGALIDLGAHPLYLSNRLMGLPSALTARYRYLTGREVEDHATLLLDYPSGASGILEVGFVSPHVFLLELHGTEGVVMVEGETLRYKPRGSDWQTPTLPAPHSSPMAQWVEMIHQDSAPLISEEDMLNLTRLNVAAAAAAQSGAGVKV